MSDANALIAAGDIDGARAALIDQVRKAPNDQGGRMFLFQLLCVLQEWEKAASQLRALASLSPEAQMLSVVYNQAIEAEKARALAFSGRGAFPVIGGGEWLGSLAEAMSATSVGDFGRATQLRDAAFDQASDTPGEIDGHSFEWISDADGRFGPALEIIVAGQWGLLGFDAISSIKTSGAKDLRDLVWLPVEVAFRSGQSAAAFLPARYPSADAADPDLRLARKTIWRAGPLGDEGVGQRLLTLDDGQELALLSIRSLQFRL